MQCRRCKTKMEISSWFPEEGLDPHLREFRCPECKATEYKIPKGFEHEVEVT